MLPSLPNSKAEHVLLCEWKIWIGKGKEKKNQKILTLFPSSVSVSMVSKTSGLAHAIPRQCIHFLLSHNQLVSIARLLVYHLVLSSTGVPSSNVAIPTDWRLSHVHYAST